LRESMLGPEMKEKKSVTRERTYYVRIQNTSV